MSRFIDLYHFPFEEDANHRFTLFYYDNIDLGSNMIVLLECLVNRKREAALFTVERRFHYVPCLNHYVLCLKFRANFVFSLIMLSERIRIRSFLVERKKDTTGAEVQV